MRYDPLVIVSSVVLAEHVEQIHCSFHDIEVIRQPALSLNKG